MGGKDWTTKERQLLIQYARDGVSQIEAAERLGRSVPSTKGFCNRQGIRFKRRMYPLDTNQTITQLILSDVSMVEISKKIDMPYPTLQHRMRNLGLHPTVEARSRAGREAYLRLREDRGLTPIEVSLLSKRVALMREKSLAGLPTEKNRDRKRR